MSNEEFENYVALMGKLLQLTPEQRDQISGELQDHLQMRVADLISEGVAKNDAISQALGEFGDAAVMAQNFQTVLKLNRRRWMMRFATYSIVGAFMAAVLTMAMWPDNARFGTPTNSLAQADSGDQNEQAELGASVAEAPNATQRTLHAEKTLKKVVDLHYTEKPFKEIEEELEAITGLNFLLHSSAQNDSLSADEPMTFNLKGMPLNKALILMLGTKNATYIIDEGVVVIISLDDAEDGKYFRLKVFDCRELVKFLPETRPTNSGGWGFGGGGFGGGGGGGVFSVPPQIASNQPKQDVNQAQATNLSESELLDQKLNRIMAMMKAQLEKTTPPPSSDQTLLDLVQTMIQPDSWQDTGQGLGQVQVVNGLLVVAQTELILQQIENFLGDLESNFFNKTRRGTKVRTSSKKSERPQEPYVDLFGADAGDIGQDPNGKDPFGQ